MTRNRGTRWILLTLLQSSAALFVFNVSVPLGGKVRWILCGTTEGSDVLNPYDILDPFSASVKLNIGKDECFSYVLGSATSNPRDVIACVGEAGSEVQCPDGSGAKIYGYNFRLSSDIPCAAVPQSLGNIVTDDGEVWVLPGTGAFTYVGTNNQVMEAVSASDDAYDIICPSSTNTTSSEPPTLSPTQESDAPTPPPTQESEAPTPPPTPGSEATTPPTPESQAPPPTPESEAPTPPPAPESEAPTPPQTPEAQQQETPPPMAAPQSEPNGSTSGAQEGTTSTYGNSFTATEIAFMIVAPVAFIVLVIVAGFLGRKWHNDYRTYQESDDDVSSLTMTTLPTLLTGSEGMLVRLRIYVFNGFKYIVCCFRIRKQQQAAANGLNVQASGVEMAEKSCSRVPFKPILQTIPA